MLRVKVSAKFPCTMQPEVMKDLLASVCFAYVERHGYLPDDAEIQTTVRLLNIGGRCTRQMFIFLWISDEVATNTAVHRSEYKAPDKKKLKKKQKDYFNKLKKVKTKATCTICQKKGFRGVVLPCGHVFHKSCIKKALQYDKRCPNCRKTIEV